MDVGFVFGTYDETFCGTGADAAKLSRCIQDAWIAFARTGDPSCESIGTWPPYGDYRVTMILGKDCHVEEAPYEGERRAWEQTRMFSGALMRFPKPKRRDDPGGLGRPR